MVNDLERAVAGLANMGVWAAVGRSLATVAGLLLIPFPEASMKRQGRIRGE